jgi:hypothetical protein
MGHAVRDSGDTWNSVGNTTLDQRIWQDLKEDYRFSYGYCSVKRFVRKIRRRRSEVAAVMDHPAGDEAQVDFFQGPSALPGPSNVFLVQPP